MCIIGSIILLFFLCFNTLIPTTELVAATATPIQQKPAFKPDSSDTSLPQLGTHPIFIAQQDTTAKDSLRAAPTKRDFETTVLYTARDTQIMNVVERTVYLKGEAKVTYGDIEMEAEEIFLNWNTNSVEAYGVADSSGKVIGLPVFTQGKTTYNAEEIIYNFRTEKGKIKGIVTQQGDGYLRGVNVKKTPQKFLYVQDALYTTCNLEHPHYGIKSKKLKATPGKSVVSGPFFLEFAETPIPLGFLFGLFPANDKKTSGIIVPVYGESREQGFYLRNGGFYLNLGEYIDLTVLGNIYTFGSWGLDVRSKYDVRYKFSGSISASFNKIIRESEDLSRNITNDFQIKWSHQQRSRKSSNFSANVNVASSSYNRNNSFAINDYIRAASSSNINYQKKFTGTPFSLGLNIRQNQNFTTDLVDISPNINVSMNRVFPFKQVGKKKNVLNQLSFSYTGRANMRITNDTNQLIIRPRSSAITFTGLPTVREQLGFAEGDTSIDFYSNFSSFLDQAQYGAVHNIPVSTNLTLFKYFQFSPSFNYTQYWYPRKFSYQAINDDTVRVIQEKGFSRAYEYSTSLGFNTRLYLFMYLKGGAAMRNTINFTLSYGYQPNFGEESFGFYQSIPRDDNNENEIVLSRFLGSTIGLPRNNNGQTSSLTLAVDNFLELKVRNKKDTTGKKPAKKIPLLRANFSYNLLADSLALSNISITVPAFSLFDRKLNINLRATLDPYSYELLSFEPSDETDPDSRATVRQRRTKEFAWQTGNGIGSLRSTAIAISGNFKAPEGRNKQEEEDEFADNPLYDDIRLNPHQYVDFQIPWSFRFNYTLTYEKRGFEDANVNQTLTGSGDISLTKKWKVSLRTGWDFEAKNFTVTSFSIFRDLHCWQMSLSWIPFGPRQSYEINVGVKSSLLKDLKYQKRNSWRDR